MARARGEEHGRSTALRAFLREHRGRISPRDAGLPVRLGRRLPGLSAEDVAELIGVSTRWYLHFELGHGGRHVSLQFLDRLAAALRLDGEAKIRLYRLAFHEIDDAAAHLERRLRSVSLTERSRGVLDAFGSFRRITRRLWAATTETEALTLVSESIADHLRDADFVGSHTRTAPGVWQFPTVIATEHVQQGVEAAFGDILSGLTPGQIDELMLSRVLTEPGQANTKSELFKSFDFAARINHGFERAGFRDTEFVIAHMRSRGGFEANIFAACLAQPRSFAEVELAEMSTLGELTSLALS